MRIRTTDCCLIRKGSGIVMTQEQSNQNECQILIYSVQDFLARLSPSPENVQVLVMPEEPCSLKLPDWLQTNDLRIFSLKTYPVSYRITGAGRLRPSSVRWMDWGTMSYGKCLTAQILELPSQEKECSLSDFIEKSVPEKYCLSQTQIQKLLSKEFPERKETESTPLRD